MSVAGHFGEWLQGRLGPDGPVALVTLLCPALHVRTSDTARRAVRRPARRPVFTPEQLAPFWETLEIPAVPLPNLTYDMPLGAGAGASTATLIAYAKHAGFSGEAEQLVKGCLAVEGASDPLMLPDADSLLWASREGLIVAKYKRPPACTVLGGFWGAPEQTDATDQDFPDISELAEDWANFSDLASLGAIASQSSERCTALRRSPETPSCPTSDPLPDLAKSLGALGHIRAHTGSARGLIFPVGAAPKHGLEALGEAGLTATLAFQTGAS
ncbi:propanediol utilization protein [Lentibacter algarum]|uniref:propanediol utilization protein n=1 Tax=Lentibacter algarum TaxID=576131 RepID=UPI001C06C40C|nr:propanediol utilization protein [Lentibacter algarum]MBU2981665.1 propanediol utilization protein [Lentibacter algarum]